ncbi:hypothetical protein PoB_000283500 [Plakobranchus ocellatus]|uniref:Uncharacterized protein n=1 Tax=Plakobranchus ocellatus TaxID=259542 RepID=A0AAV3Y0U8_9GAST|nr:hypothetical protein PoB_000283500 [Plakobranchus ocellatus]
MASTEAGEFTDVTPVYGLSIVTGDFQDSKLGDDEHMIEDLVSVDADDMTKPGHASLSDLALHKGTL